jgi:hypothetical protein
MTRIAMEGTAAALHERDLAFAVAVPFCLKLLPLMLVEFVDVVLLEVEFLVDS